MSEQTQNNEVRHNPEEGRFDVRLGDELAVLEYELDGRDMVFTSTRVPEAHRGRGIATRLVKAGIDHARREGYRIEPRCPFVKAYLRRHPE